MTDEDELARFIGTNLLDGIGLAVTIATWEWLGWWAVAAFFVLRCCARYGERLNAREGEKIETVDDLIHDVLKEQA